MFYGIVGSEGEACFYESAIRILPVGIGAHSEEVFRMRAYKHSEANVANSDRSPLWRVM
jgi:hypothetical protein